MSFKNKTHRNRRYTTFAKLEDCYFLRKEQPKNLWFQIKFKIVNKTRQTGNPWTQTHKEASQAKT